MNASFLVLLTVLRLASIEQPPEGHCLASADLSSPKGHGQLATGPCEVVVRDAPPAAHLEPLALHPEPGREGVQLVHRIREQVAGGAETPAVVDQSVYVDQVSALHHPEQGDPRPFSLLSGQSDIEAGLHQEGRQLAHVVVVIQDSEGRSFGREVVVQPCRDLPPTLHGSVEAHLWPLAEVRRHSAKRETKASFPQADFQLIKLHPEPPSRGHDDLGTSRGHKSIQSGEGLGIESLSSAIAVASSRIQDAVDVEEDDRPHASDSTTPPRLGAALWLLQDGTGDQGIGYDLLTLPSPVRAGKYWRLSLLLGSRSGGVSLTTDLWTEEWNEQTVTVTLGGAAVTENLEAGEWTPGLVCTLRIGGGANQ